MTAYHVRRILVAGRAAELGLNRTIVGGGARPPWSCLAVVLALLSGLSSCVIPTAPRWSDPQSNYPPDVRYATPPIGSILGPTNRDGGTASLTFEVRLGDPNTQDKLYLHWLIDFPPYEDGISQLFASPTLPGGNTVERAPVRFVPDCLADNITRNFPTHRLLLAVADRPFLGDEASQPNANATTDEGFVVEGAWQFELDCK